MAQIKLQKSQFPDEDDTLTGPIGIQKKAKTDFPVQALRETDKQGLDDF